LSFDIRKYPLDLYWTNRDLAVKVS